MKIVQDSSLISMKSRIKCFLVRDIEEVYINLTTLSIAYRCYKSRVNILSVLIDSREEKTARLKAAVTGACADSMPNKSSHYHKYKGFYGLREVEAVSASFWW